MGPKSIHKAIAKHARFVWLDNNNNGGWDMMIQLENGRSIQLNNTCLLCSSIWDTGL